MPRTNRAPRRKRHKNSKLGCATCKRRRVKCLETLPECANCVKHGSRCDYLEYNEEQLKEFRRAKRELLEHGVSRKIPDTASSGIYPEKSLNGSASGDSVRSCQTSGVTRPPLAVPMLTRPPLPGDSFVSSGLEYPGMPIPLSSSCSGDPSFHARRPALAEPHATPIISEHTRVGPSVNGFENLLPQAVVSPVIPRTLVDSSVYVSDPTQEFDGSLVRPDRHVNCPVYAFQTSGKPEWRHNSSPALPTRLKKDESSSGTDSRCFSEGDVHTYRPRKMISGEQEPKSLPHAVHKTQTFQVLLPQGMDYNARLVLSTKTLGPLITEGKSNLQQIRELYHVWLGHVFFTAFELSIMFSCLTNLTTNYLISNVFRGRHHDSLGFAKATDLSRQTLLMCLIQHYASVIRSLRYLLNGNIDPQLVASVSYILSIMSIYDPEATVNSTVCYRDGMFSVLSYTLQLFKTHGYDVPLFVPIHTQLVSNIVRTVYLPAYDPGFLDEYEAMLRRLGAVISSIKPSDVLNAATFGFISAVYEDLWKFCQEAVSEHIPAINANLADIPFQLDVLFNMLRKCATLGPSRLLTVSTSTDPLEKVLTVFFRLFRKAVYAVVPHVKFCFLRDFDSPLMLDVFPSSCDASMLYSLDSPLQVCVIPDTYSQIVDELRLLAAYAIRVTTFMNMRISVLYKNLVYSEKVRRLYPIDNIVDWKDSICDIHATRKEFQDRIGLRETCIANFNSTYISQVHYPRIVESGPLDQMTAIPKNAATATVDLLSLSPHGLLERDELPPTSEQAN